jgi:hypothetical protein
MFTYDASLLRMHGCLKSVFFLKQAELVLERENRFDVDEYKLFGFLNCAENDNKLFIKN